MAYESIITDHFSKKFHDLTDKNAAFKIQIVRKLREIRQNPDIGEPKRGRLRGLRGVHISEHVVVYLIYQNYVVFIELEHHDKAYDTSEGLMERILEDKLEDKRLIASLIKLDIPVDEFTDFVESLRNH